METVFILKASDLNLSFLNAIKSLFKKNQEIKVQITSNRIPSVLQDESKNDANSRIEKSYKNLKGNRNTVNFTGKEFEALMQKFHHK